MYHKTLNNTQPFKHSVAIIGIQAQSISAVDFRIHRMWLDSNFISPTHTGCLPIFIAVAHINRYLVGATGFEPATSASQMPRSSQTEPRPEIFRLHAPEMHFCAFYLLTHFGFDIHWIKSNCVYLHQFSPLIAASTLRFKCLRQFFLCFRVKQEPRPLTRTLEIII